MDSLETKTNNLFGKFRKYLSNIGDYLTDFKTSARLGLASLGIAGYLASAKPANADLSWYVNTTITTNSDAGGIYVQFRYEVVDTSTPGIDNEIVNLQLGAGTNYAGKIFNSFGYYQNELGYPWTTTLSNTNVNWNYSPNGQPITATGDPGADYGFFYAQSHQTNNIVDIPFNAVSRGSGDFPALYVKGPGRNEVPPIIEPSLAWYAPEIL